MNSIYLCFYNKRLFQASGAVHFDISPVYGTAKQDLNIDSIRDYFLKYNMFDL